MDYTQFKYAEQLKKLHGCPPSDYKETQRSAYRFIKEDSLHPDNFTPVSILKPNRCFKNEKSACAALGLSMFENKDKAKQFFRQRVRKFPRFAKIVGNHLATLNVEIKDGIASKPEKLNFGHITFHEYLWCDFYQKIKETEPI
ncbi:MAG TPA: hypothetical protein ENJ95_23370 [Bacteroidetes bacterium]|nr:hypothetical protein [Bacteroidota bacterium]